MSDKAKDLNSDAPDRLLPVRAPRRPNSASEKCTVQSFDGSQPAWLRTAGVSVPQRATHRISRHFVPHARAKSRHQRIPPDRCDCALTGLSRYIPGGEVPLYGLPKLRTRVRFPSPALGKPRRSETNFLADLRQVIGPDRGTTNAIVPTPRARAPRKCALSAILDEDVELGWQQRRADRWPVIGGPWRPAGAPRL